MQVQPCDSLRVAIGEMQAVMALKGYPGRTRSLTALYVRCVEAGVERANACESYPAPPANYRAGEKKINIKFSSETRIAIKQHAGLYIAQRDMVNILALWGQPAVMQYVDALGYNDAPKPKQGRPRKHDLVS